MYGWRGGVCILVWAYKKRENISLFSKMYACHPPPYILESGKMYAPTSTCASWFFKVPTVGIFAWLHSPVAG
jgi:hypothetical protein